jgi:hypothetical protein
MEDIDINSTLSQILPYRGANKPDKGDFGCPLPENAPLAVDSPRWLTRNRQ